LWNLTKLHSIDIKNLKGFKKVITKHKRLDKAYLGSDLVKKKKTF